MRGNNDTLGPDGLKALIDVLKQVTSHKQHRQLSLCGVTPGQSRIEVPKEMPPTDLALVAAELACGCFAEGVGQSMGAKAAGGGKDGTMTLNRRSHQQGSDWNALMWGSRYNRLNIVRQLLDSGHDVNEQEAEDQAHNKYAPIHWAAHKGHLEMVRLLIERGARLDMKDKHGNTPKQLAEKRMQAERSGEAQYKAVVDEIEGREIGQEEVS